MVKKNGIRIPGKLFPHKIECHSCTSDVVLMGMLDEERNMTLQRLTLDLRRVN